MAKIRKPGFLQGPKGQRFFNFCYSIGAAIVIWGALFKILHLPMGNTLLCIGMGTEVMMFVLTAFDRPPKEYEWQEVFPVLDSHDPEDRPNFGNGGSGVVVSGNTGNVEAVHAPSQEGGIVVAGGGMPLGAISEDDAQSLHDSIQKMASASEQLAQMAELTTATRDYLSQIAGIADQMAQLKETTASLNEVSSTLLKSYEAITLNQETISNSSQGYVNQMEDLNRNIGGLNTIYEIQLKSISSQLESIDRVNRGLKDIRDMYEKSARQSSRYCEETERMARYMKQLNGVYEKMITAMTINMNNPMMGGGAMGGNTGSPFAENDD